MEKIPNAYFLVTVSLNLMDVMTMATVILAAEMVRPQTKDLNGKVKAAELVCYICLYDLLSVTLLQSRG